MTFDLSHTYTPETLPSVSHIIRTYKLSAQKSLGQHFLLDPHITDKIVSYSTDITKGITFEIGPGPGTLTRSLLKQGAFVIAIEKDKRFVEALHMLKSAYPNHLTIIEGDARSVHLQDDFTHIRPNEPRRIIANLPYNVGTDLFYNWIGYPTPFDEMILMFQKEVVDRIVSEHSCKSYGKLSILTQNLYHTKRLYHVPPSAFTPPPRVMSSIVRLTPRDDFAHNITHHQTLSMMTNHAFSNRRKMIKKALAPFIEQIPHLLQENHVEETLRPENLSPQTFANIAKLYMHIKETPK